MIQIVKKTAPVLLALFILESIVFQVISIKKFNDFRYHNHILDDGTILTYNELTDKKGDCTTSVTTIASSSAGYGQPTATQLLKPCL